jgi:hypothetical protein
MAEATGRFHLWVESCAGTGLPVDTFGRDGDGDWAFGAFLEEWAVGFLLVLGGISVDELHIAGTKNLESIVKVCAGSEGLSAEASAGVVDLEEAHGLRGPVAYGRFHVRGVATRDDKNREKSKNAEMTHGVKGIRVESLRLHSGSE